MNPLLGLAISLEVEHVPSIQPAQPKRCPQRLQIHNPQRKPKGTSTVIKQDLPRSPSLPKSSSASARSFPLRRYLRPMAHDAESPPHGCWGLNQWTYFHSNSSIAWSSNLIRATPEVPVSQAKKPLFKMEKLQLPWQGLYIISPPKRTWICLRSLEKIKNNPQKVP